MAPRSRSFVFTVNNYTENDIETLKSLDYVYLIFGYERGESNTPHLQGFIHFRNALRFSTLKQWLPRAHWEKRKGSIQQAADYCKKEGNFQEFGEIPSDPKDKGNKSKETWTTILAKAEEGDHKWIKKNHPKVWVNLSHRLESLRRPNISIIEGELLHEWWVGPTGTGKSKTVWELYPSHYQKELNKWWCGYKDEQVVVIEEWSPKNDCTGSQLKIWADRYPFTGQIKGGSLKQIRPLKIVVLSNYTIDECFLLQQDAEPLKRRFKTFRFPEDVQLVKSTGTMFNAITSLPSANDVISGSDLDQDIAAAFQLDSVAPGCELPLPGFVSNNWADYASTEDLHRLLSVDSAVLSGP